MKIVFWMDRILSELIKSLQWPSEYDLKSKQDKPLRRPSPYWIQRKVEEKLNRNTPGGKRIGGIESRWKKVESIVDMHLVLDLESFGFKRSMVSWSGGITRLKEIINSLKKLNFIEKAHSSLILGNNGTMEPLLSTEIIHMTKEDYDRKVAKLGRVLDGFKEVSSFEGGPLFKQYDEKSRKRVMNNGTGLRPKIKILLQKLIEDPLIKLPELAAQTGFSRSETKKYFYDLVHGGLILFEPAINSMALSDFTLSTISIMGDTNSINSTYKTVMGRSAINERVLLSRKYFNNVIALLCWSSSYYDVMDLYSEVSKLKVDDNIGLAWQFRSIPIKSVEYPFLED